jgi:AhpD family alkylhydroperoxidase
MTMEPRMKQPVQLVPDAYKALLDLHKAAQETGIGQDLANMVHLRASQINGCGVCVHMHARDMRKAGENDDRVDSVAAWREAPYYTDAERAALDLTEHVTRIADRPDPVPDAVFAEAAKHFDEQQLAGLLLEIAGINVWNRLNAATRQIAGDW